MKTVLAVVGLPGAGKSEASEYLQKKTGWGRIHFGKEEVTEEVEKRGLPFSDDNEKKIREDLRKQYGMGALAILNMPKVKSLFEQGSVIVESMYSWEEYLELKKEFGESFKALAIFASPTIRASRLANRSVRPLTAEEFVSRDYSQIENLHQAGPIARADFMVVNEGTKEELYEQIDMVLNKL